MSDWQCQLVAKSCRISGVQGLYIGCHPEAEQFWYDDYSWMRRHWTSNRHAQLVEFADALMAR